VAGPEPGGVSIYMRCCRGATVGRRRPGSNSDLDDHLDLDTGAQRDLRYAKGAARVLALLAEHFGQEFRAAVGYQVLFGEFRRGVHQAHHLDDALHLVQVADVAVQRGQQVDGDAARGLLTGGGVDVLAELARPGLAVAAGDVARQEDGVAGARGVRPETSFTS